MQVPWHADRQSGYMLLLPLPPTMAAACCSSGASAQKCTVGLPLLTCLYVRAPPSAPLRPAPPVHGIHRLPRLLHQL